MAGGVGSRFWPFSTNRQPKQFLDFLGMGRSLLRLTFERLDGIIPNENIFVVTNKCYKDQILKQLPELSENQVLLEPLRRNTAPCIAYATYKIYKKNPMAKLLVLPSDHLITNEKEYTKVIKTGLDFVSNEDVLLTLGMKPTRPETGYGYIQMEPGTTNLRKVKTFTEKPDLEMAKIFVSMGDFVWNSGMFLWRAEVIIKEFEKYLPELADKFDSGNAYYNTDDEQAFIDRIYPLCQNVSIDYGIMEKSTNVYVLQADFGWSDLGTWNSLYDISSKDDSQNVLNGNTLLYNSKNNIVVLPPEELAVIDGLDGYLVARNNNVLLICKREEEAKIRQFVQDAEEKFNDKYI